MSSGLRISTGRLPGSASMLAIVVAALMLAGCVGVGKVAPAPRVLDIGLAAEPQQRLPARVPVAVPAVDAAPLLRGEGVIWREQGSQLPQAYASFQWASPPAELLAQRLRARLAAEGPVVSTNTSGTMPEIRVTLERFEQVFSPGENVSGAFASSGDIGVRVVLMQHGQVLDQLRLAYSIPAPSGDAEGGARALRAGVDTVAEEIAQWLSRQSGLRAAQTPPGVR